MQLHGVFVTITTLTLNVLHLCSENNIGQKNKWAAIIGDVIRSLSISPRYLIKKKGQQHLLLSTVLKLKCNYSIL